MNLLLNVIVGTKFILKKLLMIVWLGGIGLICCLVLRERFTLVTSVDLKGEVFKKGRF